MVIRSCHTSILSIIHESQEHDLEEYHNETDDDELCQLAITRSKEHQLLLAELQDQLLEHPWRDYPGSSTTPVMPPQKSRTICSYCLRKH
jgi:hypothetical protein